MTHARDGSDRHETRGGPRRGARRAWLAGLLVLASLAAGCSGVDIVSDSPRPDPALLDTALRVGSSTRADVAALLGEPQGEGEIMLPIDGTPRPMWSYYYEEGSAKAGADGSLQVEARRIFVFVYFNQDRYDGYMWFSSLPQ